MANLSHADIVKFALVGYGYSGRTFHAPLLASSAGARLHSIVTSDPANARRDFPDARVTTEFAAVCEDGEVDAIAIAVPNQFHAELAHRALDHGKHVVIDKPFAVTVSETDELIAHANTKRLKISAFHNRRWDADFLTLQDVLNHGLLGTVFQFESHYDRFRPTIRDRWRETSVPGGGSWFDLGPHLVDQALILFGPPKRVFADMFPQRPGAEVDDYFHVIFDYDRMRVILHGSAYVPGTALRFAIHGENGSYCKSGFDVQETQLKSGLRPTADAWGVDPVPGTFCPPGDPGDGNAKIETIPNRRGDYGSFYTQFAAAVRSGGPVPVTPAQIRSVMSLLALCQDSARQRRTIELPNPTL